MYQGNFKLKEAKAIHKLKTTFEVTRADYKTYKLKWRY